MISGGKIPHTTTCPVGVVDAVVELFEENSPEKIATAKTKPMMNTMTRIVWNDDFMQCYAIYYLLKSIA